MSRQPPQLRDQSAVRMGLRIGGALVAVTGLILIIVAIASFFSAANSTSLSPPRHFWMFFVGGPLLVVGLGMLGAGFLGATTRYAAGEVMPTVRESLDYVGVGAHHPATCPFCGHPNPPGSGICGQCGKPVPPG
jgi:hypothetical protein